MGTLICQLKPYIQPFEKKLAIQELARLSLDTPEPLQQSEDGPALFQVKTASSSRALATRLAYWEYITDRKPICTAQALREATVNAVRNGVSLDEIRDRLPFTIDAPIPNRRCLRYGTHGIHEYRGKFFPQLVVALMNMAGVKRRDVIGDPMCGSGTTLVEAVLAGQRALGIDMNPLSVLMSSTKCSLLATTPKAIEQGYDAIRRELANASPQSFRDDLPYLSSLADHDQQYLLRWFPAQALADLDLIVRTILAAKPTPVRDLMRISLSNVLRKLSWQKEDDLRVRKEVPFDRDIDPIREFLEELGRSVRLVLALLYQQNGARIGQCKVKSGDAKKSSEVWSKWRSKVDAIITSPPYATALPYLDTDRLSLIYLGLLARSEHRGFDRRMIGNREISTKRRDELWKRFCQQCNTLPESVTTLVKRIRNLNEGTDAGFRRQNLPALLAKYFFDMREVLRNMEAVLRPHAPAYVVVGNNHTIAGGGRVDIATAHLLAEIADGIGFEVENTVPMEMLVSRDIFRKNAVASEYILCLRKKS